MDYKSNYQEVVAILLIHVEKVEKVFLARFRDSGYFCSVILILLNLVHQIIRGGVYR